MVDYAGQLNIDTYSLGAQTAEYKPRSTARVLRLIFGFILGVVGVFTILYGAMSAQIAGDDRPPIIILGAILAGFAWLMVEIWLKGNGLSVQVFADGLARNQYGKTVVVRWDEIVGIWQAVTKHYTNGIYTGTTHVYTVQKADNTRVKFDDALKNVEQLGNTMQSEVTRRLLPQAINTFQGGGTVTFGKLVVSPIGLSWGDKSLPWAEIEGVQLNKGYLSVKKQGKWFNWASMPVSAIPNLLVALTLIDRIVGLTTKK
jgi:hypothetical protein